MPLSVPQAESATWSSRRGKDARSRSRSDAEDRDFTRTPLHESTFADGTRVVSVAAVTEFAIAELAHIDELPMSLVAKRYSLF